MVCNNSSSGYLLADAELQEKKGTVSRDETARIFAMVTEAGYASKKEPPIEPGIKIVVVLADNTRITNSGPGDFSPDADKKAFRDIESALTKAAKVFDDDKVFRYYGTKYKDL